MEKTDESVIDQNLQPGDIVDQKERRRYLREELRFHQEQETFAHANQAMERNMFVYLMDIFTKANSLLNVVNQDSFNIFREVKKIKKNMTDA